jgi:Predicted amidohydrolase
MAERFRLSLAQLNPTVGDLRGNAAQAKSAWVQAKAAGADMVAFPEMFLTGYQLQDLVGKPAFAADVQQVLAQLAQDCADGPAIGIGAPLPGGDKPFNGYFILQDGKIAAQVMKPTCPITMCSTKSAITMLATPRVRCGWGRSASACQSAKMHGSKM